MSDQERNYWLFIVTVDGHPTKWKTMLYAGLAAQHYPEGWQNEARNINALHQIRRGDRIVAAFRDFRFGGYGTVTSDFFRGGASLDIRNEGDTSHFAYAERFSCDWTAIPPDRTPCCVDCHDVRNKQRLRLNRGCCVKQIDEDTFDFLKTTLDRNGAVRHVPRTLAPTKGPQEDKLAKFTHDFNTLADAFRDPLLRAEAARRKGAPTYNVFTLLGIATNEDKTHTPMLADLLNPRGSHGQGAVFLEAFLARCAKKRGFVPPAGDIYTTSWVMQMQRFTKFGVIDLVLIAPSLQFLIAIENKVYAGEQEGQLDRYYRWLETQQDCYPHRNLIFLTPDGRGSDSAVDAKYVQLSYRDDIAAVLDASLSTIEAERVRGLVCQYRDIVSDIDPGTVKGDSE